MPGWMSVKGLYDWDPTLFNGLQIPAPMNKNIMINYIIEECSDLEVAITNPETLKVMIESWSLARLHSWSRLYESTVQEYNMIHNYDRHEDWSDEGENTTAGNTNITNSKAAYNNSNPVVSDKQNQNGNNTITLNTSHTGHMYGNIGVVTTQKMLTEERKVATYDVYMAITDEFRRKFCIAVY